jgi:hypothetical protein
MSHEPLPAQGPVDVIVGQRWRVRVVGCGQPCWLADVEGDPGRTLVSGKARTFAGERAARRAAQIALAHYGREYFIESVPNAGSNGPSGVAAKVRVD